jgi:hypothetical protein
MVYFEIVFIRGKYLGSFFEYSSTIKPTGVESERVFLAAGLFTALLSTDLCLTHNFIVIYLKLQIQNNKIKLK